MRYLVFILLLISGYSYGQSTYYIRADSVRFQKVGGNTVFILENGSRSKTNAFLRNYSNGRTDFAYAIDSIWKVNDSMFVFRRGDGNDTILIPGSGGGAAGWSLTGNASTSGKFIGTTDAQPLAIYTNNSERMRIAAAGNVGIGTSSPLSLFNVERNNIIQGQSDTYGIMLSNTSNAASGNNQYSPGIVWRGGGFRSVGGTTRQLRFRADLVSVGSAGTPFGYWRLGYCIDSTTGTYKPIMSVYGNTGNIVLMADSALGTVGSINSIKMGSSLGLIFMSPTQPTNYGTTSGANNLAIGTGALALTSGSFNIAIGGAMTAMTTGGINTAIGNAALGGNVDGTSNVAVGTNAIKVATTGDKNTAIGTGTMEALTTGQENVALGYNAGLNATTAIRNTWVGVDAKSGTDGYQNFIGGYDGGASLTAGNHDNVIIGYAAGFNASQLATATNSVAIGSNSFTTANNQVVIGNSSMTQFNFWGALMPAGSAGTSGQVLISQGANTSPVYTSSPTGFTIPINKITDATGAGSVANANLAQSWTWDNVSTNGLALSSSGSSVGNGLTNTILPITASGSNTNSSVITRGFSSIITRTGAGTPTNIAGNFSASGATTNTAINIAAGALTLNGSAGTSGQLLTSAGASTLPTWTSPSSLTGLPYWALIGTSTITGTTLIDGSTNDLTIQYNGAKQLQFRSGGIKIGDPDHNGNGNELTVDDDNSKAYFDNTAHNINVGINTATPAVALDGVGTLHFDDGATGNIQLGDLMVAGNGNALNLSSVDPSWSIGDGNGAGNAFLSGDVSSGDFTIGSTNSVKATILSGTGTRAVLADPSGFLSAPVSDRSVKSNIKNINGAIGKIMQLRPVTFEYKEGFKNYGHGTQVGFIAQEVANVLPNSVYTNSSNGKMGYNEVDIIPLLVAGMQSQQKEIEALKAEIKKLKRR